MGWHRIGAATIADNHRSARLLDRIGFFQQEGTRRGYSLEEDGVFHHGAVYRLLAGEWLPAG